MERWRRRSYSREEKRPSRDEDSPGAYGVEIACWSHSGITVPFAVAVADEAGDCAGAGVVAGLGADVEPGSKIKPRFLASSMICRASLMSNAILLE